MISADEKDLFRAAEQKQWDEHLQYGAVRPLSLEESARVEVEVGKERILPSRFLYRDKNLAKRRSDPTVECKAKARLCVGGQRDPDLGTTEMAVDAPTANRHSILLCLLLALSWSWRVSIGDIRAAFLNGVEAPRKLYFKQPVRGLPQCLLQSFRTSNTLGEKVGTGLTFADPPPRGSPGSCVRRCFLTDTGTSSKSLDCLARRSKHTSAS